ncbi:MAG: dihydroneopterin aldolase family protein [Halobacteria archaeon]
MVEGNRNEDVEKACFEAGIKMGALYHQYTGAPMEREAVDQIQEAIEASVESQRYVTDVTVDVDVSGFNRFGYTELEGNMMDVRLTVEYSGVEVVAVMEEEDGYPMMNIENIDTGNSN